MKKEIPLGINRRKMKPFNVLVCIDSISEKNLLQQQLKSVEFNTLTVDDEVISYLLDGINGKEESSAISLNRAEEEFDEEFGEKFDEEMKISRILGELSQADILCIEYTDSLKGSEFIHTIQKMYPAMMVVLIVGNVTKESLEQILKVKANAYLVKPITINTLCNKLKFILSRKDLAPKEAAGDMQKGIKLTELMIPPVSEVLTRVMLFHSDKAGGSEELEQIISPDKSLSADLLRIANSSFYGRSGSVTTLKEAITLIGLKTINNIAVVKTRKTYIQSLDHPLFKSYLDEYPILAGLIALDLSGPLNLKKLNDQIFIHSVLLKIGMTILALNQPQNYLHILNEYKQGLKSIAELEKEEFNTDHIEIGIKIFRLWRLPKSMQKVVQNQKFTINQINDVSDLDRLLRIADIFALKLIGKVSIEDIQLILRILEYYQVSEDIIGLFNKDYYTHIKNHPFFDII